MRGGIFWWPRVFSLENYKTVFKDSSILTAFGVTVLRTLVGTVLNVFFTAMVAYGLSKTRLIGRNFYLTMGIITMMFNGCLLYTSSPCSAKSSCRERVPSFSTCIRSTLLSYSSTA